MRMRAVGIALCLGLIGGAATLAVTSPVQAQKKARKAKKATDAAQEQEKAEAAQKKADERQAPAKFSWTVRSERDAMDERADKKRDEAILKLKKILPSIQAGPQKAELIFRLSEMYWSKSKFKHLQAMQIWDKQLEQWHESGAKGEQPKLEAIAEADESGLYKRQALKLYEEILGEYPTYHRKDEVLYNLGSSLYEAGNKTEGVKRYWELIKQYPNSDYAADAWLELGEHFFNNNKLTQAITAYTKAAETKKPRIYSFALYKLAWCDYNLGEYADALDKFRQVVSYAKSRQSEDGEFQARDRVQLTEEALNDMVRAYSHLDAVEDAFEYYVREVGEEKSYTYLAKLAAKYHDEGKYSIEVKAYRELNKRWPYHPSAPVNQTAIMEAFAMLGRNDQVREEVRKLIDLYSPGGTWAQRNADRPKVLTQAFEVVEDKLAGLVTEQHRAAQETKLAETYYLARDIYKEYLSKFPDSRNAYDFRFFYAEILYELKDFEEAAPQYDMVVEANPEGKFTRPAAYSAILTWEKVAAGVKETVGKKITEGKSGKSRGDLRQLEKLRSLEKGKSYEETNLKPAEQKLADACDRFAKVAPNDEEVTKVIFKAGQLYYIHNKFEEAAERFGVVIAKWPKDDLARRSAGLVLQSFNVREDWSNLNKWARTFRGNKPLMGDRSFAETVDELVEGASFNEIHHVFEPKKTALEIADLYRGFVKEFPKSKFAMVALYNAVVNYDKSNLLEKSIETAKLVLEGYKSFKISDKDLEESKREGAALPTPESIREKILFLQASFYERLAQFDISANLYEQFAQEFPKGERRADALFNAALFREGLGEHDQAIKNFRTYIKDYPNKPDVPQLMWRVGLILEKKGDHTAVEKHFSDIHRYFKDNPAQRLCADYKVIGAVEKQAKTEGIKPKDKADLEKRAFESYKEILTAYKELPEADRVRDCALLAAANASFVMLEPEFQNYVNIPLTGVSERQMTKNLIDKLGLVESLQQAYTQVLQLGQGDYGIAALYRIGAVYQHLAQEIFATPCPRRLTEDQCMIYQAALQEKAFPLEEKAIEAYDKAMSKAYELGLYNDWLAKAQEAMKTYEPNRFPAVHEYELIASEVSSEPPAPVEISLVELQ